MTPEQSRAARGWLGWSQGDLAERAHVGLSTVKDFEAGKRRPIQNNLDAMQRTFEGAGLSFVNDASGNAQGIALSGQSPS